MAVCTDDNTCSCSDGTAHNFEGDKMRGIVTLCGSVRFKKEFDIVNRELTLAGWIVLMPGVWEHNWLHQKLNATENLKNDLDRLHREKILMSECIVIINHQDYIGESTQSELNYAIDQGKTVFWLNASYARAGRSWKELI